jgi:site-specific DNA recombinase
MHEQFFIYARKSTDDSDRQVRSIGDQLAEVRELARRHSLKIVDVLVEKQSAKKPGRPVFDEMLRRIENGDASGILAWHPDRLARNMLDGGRIIHMVDTGQIKDMKFPTVDFQPTSQGKLNLAMLFGMSKYYVDKLSEDIQRGHRQKLRDGIWPAFSPIGYLNDRKSRTIVIDPVRGPLVRKAFELYATGEYTFDQITETVNGVGLTNRDGLPLGRAQYHRMLQNPIYCGIIRYNGETYEGRHEPLFSKELFDKVQEAMRRKSKPKTPSLKPYLYRGFLRCGECGCFITTETQKGHNYLRCTKRVKRDCSQKYLREDAFATQLNRYIQSLSLPAEWADWMIAELEKEQASNTTAASDATNAITEEIKAIDERLERLMDAYLDKATTLEEYRPAKEKLIGEKKRKEGELAELERHRSGWFEPAFTFIKTAKQAAILASSHNDAKKLEFAKTTGSNFRLVNRELVSLPRDAWQLVVDQGSFAQPNAASSIDDAAFAGKNYHDSNKRRGGDSNSRYPFGQTGFRNQPDADANNDTGASCDPATTGLPASLRAALEQHPELSELIESWPNLPQSMRIGIIAMVESSAKDR